MSSDKIKTFDEYSKTSKKTLLRDFDLPYLTLGLTEEAGEVAGHVKKSIRDDGGKITAKRRELILKELGDVLWYAARMAEKLDSNLEEVAQMNINKLTSRQLRNVIKGSGDNR